MIKILSLDHMSPLFLSVNYNGSPGGGGVGPLLEESDELNLFKIASNWSFSVLETTIISLISKRRNNTEIEMSISKREKCCHRRNIIVKSHHSFSLR